MNGEVWQRASSLSRGKKPKSPKKNEWHHIVAKAAWRAASVRRVFSKVGLSVNNSQNLVKIKYGMHGRIHTKKYYALVNSIITGAYNSKIRVVSKEKKVKAALLIFKQYLITKSRFAKC